MRSYNCPKCNAEFVIGTRFCQSCGCNLEMEFVENPICPTCHKTFPTGTKYCDVDGAKLTSADRLTPRCVVCGTIYPANTKFCPKDGGAVVPDAMRYATLPPNPGTYGQLYPKASLGNRFIASLLDSLITFGLAIPSGISVAIGISKMGLYGNISGGVSFFLLAAVLYLIPLVYSLIKDGLGRGQSWGKRAVGLMVVHLPDKMPCSKGQSFLRCLIMGLLGLIPYVGWLIEPIIVLASDDGRRLGDKAAGTQVIDERHFLS